MASAAVDIGYVAGYVQLPQASIQTLVDAPTPDLVTQFLTALVTKAQQHDVLVSENLRLSVELENAVLGSEARARALKANADKALQEVESLRQKVNQDENARRELEQQLESLQASSSTSTNEVVRLQEQVKRLEKSNRDTLSLYESKSTAHDELAEELSSQHGKVVALRKQVTALEDKQMSTETAISSLRFRESNLQQEISNLKRNNDYLDTELKTKTSEYSKYRKDKSAKLAELQRALEDGNATIASLRRTDAVLQKRISELELKADEAFTKNQRMQENANRTEAAFQAELDNAKRLTELQKQAADTSKKRVIELDTQIEQIRDDAADEIGAIQAELETERQAREAVEKKLEETEVRLEALEAAPPLAREAPSTPRGASPRPGSSAMATTPASAARSRGGLTVTQAYSDLKSAMKELEYYKRRCSKLTDTLDEMVKNLEKKEPEMRELEEDHAFARAEAARLSEALGKIAQEKETARKESRKWQFEANNALQEADVLRQQLRDLSTQLKMVLVEAQLKAEGHNLSEEARQQLEQVARGTLDEAALDGMTDTGRFISENLVAFRNVFDMQEKNQELLRVTRQLGEEMEGEEARAKQHELETLRKELEESRSMCERRADEIKILIANSESFVKERDIFRRMLSHRGRLPPDADVQAMFGESITGAGSPSASQIGGDNGEVAKQLSDHVKMLKEIQSQYDTFRKETVNDQAATRAQVEQLTRDKHELQNERARLGSQLELARERYEMLQSNFKFLEQQKEESGLRQQALAESAARQDIKTQQVAEELIEAKELSESLKNENSNLKMERELWKRVESRINEENQALLEEKTRLNKAVADIQSLTNERERTESELRRRVQSEKDALEAQLRETRRKLDDEVEEGKRATLRREFEQEQSRSRIDDLTKSLSNAKEELVAAKTTRDQLQARVEELKIELRSAEERAQALRPLPTPRAPTASAVTDENALTREQELGIELADIRREFELTKSELESARGEIEQYKAIARDAEEQLGNFNETQEQYIEEMDAAIAERDTKIKDLQQRVEDISSELTDTNNQLSELRTSANDSNTILEQQRASFEAELARVKDESERHQEAANFHREDLKAQAQIAQQAQESYENELLKHAEAARQLQDVRNKYNEIKLEVSQSKAEAEAARVALSQNEDSWASIKEQYEKEITEMRRRRDDVNQQNKLLHAQLESVGKQIASLQQKRAANQTIDDATSDNADLQGLQEVIRYLRQEKEIVDEQYELSTKEVGRLRQRLDYTQSQLDETRLKLDQERQRQTDATQTSISHSKLVDTINELNVFRESSVTLRNEARQAQAQLAEKSKEVERLLAEIEPLEETKRTLENEKEMLQGEYNLLKEDRDRWQTRTQSILQKYDRVDPAELEGYKERISTLESSLEQATTESSGEKQSLQERIEALEKELEAKATEFNERREKIVEQSKSRSREQVGRIRNLEAEVTSLQSQLETARAELQTATQARDEAVAASQTTKPSEDVEMADAAEEGQVEEEGEQSTATDSNQKDDAAQIRISELEGTVQTQQTTLSELQTELESLRQTAETAQARVAELEAQLEVAQEEIAQLKSAPSAQGQPSEGQDAATTEAAEHLEKLTQELTAAKEEVEALRAAQTSTQPSQPAAGTTESQQASNPGSAPLSAEEITQQVDAQVAAIRAELDAAHAERIRVNDETVARRSDQIKTKANEAHRKLRENLQKEYEDKLAQEKESYTSELNKEHQEAISQLQDVHQKALDAARSEHADTIKTETKAEVASTAEATPAGNADMSGFDFTQLTLEQAQKACTSEHVRTIVSRNIRGRLEEKVKQLTEQHEQNVATINSEHEKTLAEKEVFWKKQKDNAALLESKKFAAKVNMMEARNKTLTAKIAIVEVAAKETPDEPVKLIWVKIQEYKPPPAGAQSTPAAAPSTPTKAAGASTAPSTTPVGPAPAPAAANIQQVAIPTTETQTAATTESQTQPEQQEKLLSRPPSRATSRPPSSAGGSSIPTASGRGNHVGTGPAALRGVLQQSGLPRGGAAAAAAAGNTNTNTRGGNQGSRIPSFGSGNGAGGGGRGGAASNIPRGGGRGGNTANQGRGGAFNPNASTFQPTSGAENSGAGAKRARDEQGGDANTRGGKRARGRGNSGNGNGGAAQA